MSTGRQRSDRRGAYASAALTCALSAAFACAESSPVQVALPSGEGAAGPEFGGVEVPSTCGDGALVCGAGCCASGEQCYQDQCLPDLACTSSDECGSDSLCGGGACVSWRALPSAMRRDQSCRRELDLASLEPVVQCQWPGDGTPGVAPDSVQVIAAPMVVDFNFDDNPSTRRPSIVFVSHEPGAVGTTGVLRVIDGETCELQASIQGEFAFSAEVSPALGDVDGDGRPDVVVIDEQPFGAALRSGVSAYSWSGTEFELSWQTRSASVELIQGVALHDLDDDGLPEILTEGALFRGTDGTQLVTIPGGALEPPIVMDVDRDLHSAEIVTSEGIFLWDSLNDRLVSKPRTPGDTHCEDNRTCLWNPASNVDGLFVALADFREFQTAVNLGGDSVEMVVVGLNGEIWLKQIDGQTHLHIPPGSNAGGPPVIADVDGDGRPEFASAGREYVSVYDLDCKSDDFFDARGCGGGEGQPSADALLWRKRIQGARSGVAMFDFDGDGRVEVASSDQCYLRIHDGLTGDVAFSVPRSSTTRWGYPVVVDADGDGHSEIVTASNDDDLTIRCPDFDPLHPSTAYQATHGVTVWRDPDDRWQGSRPVWNQHTYYVSHVNDDGTIPRTTSVEGYLDSSNSFRQNVLGATGVPLDEPDLTVWATPGVTCVGGRETAWVEGELCNRGLREIASEDASVTLLRADDARELCVAHAQGALEAGSCEAFACEIAVPFNREPFDVELRADMGGLLDECHEGNNGATVARVQCTTASTVE